MNTPRLIRPSDFDCVGRDRRQLVALCNKGELTRVRRGVYAWSADWKDLPRLEQYGLKVQALQQVSRTQPVLAHATAALLWGLWIVGTPRKLHVMTDVTSGGRNENGVIRHRGSMTQGVVQCGSFLLTDKLTTVMQLMLSLDFPYAVAVCDSSLRQSPSRSSLNHFSLVGSAQDDGEPVWQSAYPQGCALLREELEAAASRLPSRAARVRAATVISFASSLSGSAGESLSRAKMHMFGFPAPVLQKKFTLRDGHDAFTDFWFKEINLSGEFDGREKYLRAGWGNGMSIQDRVMREKDREDAIRAQGVGFVRWTWAEMMNKERFIYLLRQAGLRQQ
ncbi:type IV toxin-antitoxin system AbiEi family antitoxin domain-containing protein [Arthrobacter sp. HY1533]|uniref:type IV toxin-antitoxin system AbiEi family antitoxin domain-containing protein n=1 Tax=Arthrobacter sp. HY1533 TaxID=2970919 RepID=UPI0022B9F9A2|nr:type IV toxin-antitoxin system AbiEi family antitoxin domain-containing protein [Arthrobacter sp. HY1533]